VPFSLADNFNNTLSTEDNAPFYICSPPSTCRISASFDDKTTSVTTVAISGPNYAFLLNPVTLGTFRLTVRTLQGAKTWVDTFQSPITFNVVPGDVRFLL
jgi:hypothetical protein